MFHFVNFAATTQKYVLFSHYAKHPKDKEAVLSFQSFRHLDNYCKVEIFIRSMIVDSQSSEGLTIDSEG